jgi:hypothetical protein
VKDHKDISAQQIVKCLVENGNLIPRKDGMLIGLIAEEDIECENRFSIQEINVPTLTIMPHHA